MTTGMDGVVEGVGNRRKTIIDLVQRAKDMKCHEVPPLTPLLSPTYLTTANSLLLPTTLTAASTLRKVCVVGVSSSISSYFTQVLPSSYLTQLPCGLIGSFLTILI